MFGSKQSIGVDIGDDAVRVVALRAAGTGYELTYVACIPLDGERTAEDTASILRTLFREAGAARVAGALPASGCALKTASLPPAKPAELAQVARFEAETQFPLPLGELVWDFTLSPDPGGRQHAVIVGARRALVDEQLALLRQAGATPVGLYPAPLAAADALCPPEGTNLLVVAGAAWSDLCLFDGERLLGCRSILAGYPGAEGWTERIAREVRPWIAGHDRPACVVLVGEVTPARAEALQARIEVPVSLGNPWDGVRDPQNLLRGLHGAPSSYATAVGLAQAALGPRTGINLLPPQVLAGDRTRRKLAWSLAGLALAAALLIPVALSGGERLRARQAQLQQVQQQVRQVKRSRGPAPGAGMVAARRALVSLRTPASKPLDILRVLSADLPDGITLADLSFERGKVVVLKGHANTNEEVAGAMRVLKDVTLVERAMLDYAHLAKEEDGPGGYDFQITCTLAPTDDPTILTGRGRNAKMGTKVR